jgi:TonB family protein
MTLHLLVAALLGGAQLGGQPAGSGQTNEPGASRLVCQQALARQMANAASELCLGEQELQAGTSLPKTDSRRADRFRSAATHLRRGAADTPDVELKALVVEMLVGLFDESHLNAPGEQESAMRQLIALRPNDLDPLFRLAGLQEKWGLIELAEDTLIGARRKQPDALEPYHRLAQFYARRAAALQTPEKRAIAQAEPSAPGQPDAQGVYRAGGVIETPRREGTPRYPTDARGTGVEGIVGVEIIVGPEGTVTDARVVRSIPLLDNAALEAVKKWRYEPTIVNGQPVSIRLTTTINFTLQR